MDLKEYLKRKSQEITESAYTLRDQHEKERAQKLESIEITREDIKIASAMGDRSENAAFSDAVTKLQQLQTQLVGVEAKLKSLESISDDTNYVPMGKIILYTTFMLRDNFGEEFIFKMYPKGVSDIDKLILDKESPLGKLLWLKEQGDVVTLEHKVSGEPISYTVVEIY